jgi:hypothetical protein
VIEPEDVGDATRESAPLTEAQTLDLVLKHVALAADMAWLDSAGMVPADRTRAAIRAALECGLANGLIKIMPAEGWPEFVALTPPYRPLAGRA